MRWGKEGWMAGRIVSGNGLRTPNLGRRDLRMHAQEVLILVLVVGRNETAKSRCLGKMVPTDLGKNWH